MQASRRDAILACATPPGAAERAILRLSGPDLLALDGAHLPEGFAALWQAWEATGMLRGIAMVDWAWLPALPVPVEAWSFPGPHSSTGEDVVELHLAGAPPLVDALQAAWAAVPGVREAEPGEFTRRAFLSGRLDLTQAEAVLGLVTAQDAQQARASAGLLLGALAADLEAARRALADAMVQVEAGLDFEEGDSQDLQPGEIRATLAAADAALARGQRETARGAWEARDQWRIGLVGAPNAGKTALFRALTGVDALVADQRGTTRDRLEAAWRVGLGGRQWCLADGPGRSETPVDARDAEAQRRARSHDHFDVVWQVLDGSAAAPPEAWDRGPAPDLTVFTKCDLDRRIPAAVVQAASARGPVVFVSASSGHGLERLLAETQRLEAARAADWSAAAQVSARHQQALRDAREAVAAAQVLDEAGGHQDLVAEELRRALGALAELVGEFTPEDLLDQLFSSFCVGK